MGKVSQRTLGLLQLDQCGDLSTTLLSLSLAATNKIHEPESSSAPKFMSLAMFFFILLENLSQRRLVWGK
jgi:hypothetical protein